MAGELSNEDYAAVEAAAYEAAIVPELWPDLLARLGTVSNSAGAALLCINERGPHLTCAPELEQVARRFLSEGWIGRNSRTTAVIARGLVGAPRFINEDDYLDDLADVETDPMVSQLFRPEGYGWVAGFLVQLPHGDLVVMDVEQYYERGPIRGDDLARLDSLYPHLARAAMLGGRADFQRVRNAIETLTALGLPAVALTPSGRVVLANDDFTQASHVWATRGGDRLGLHDRAADALLSTSLATIELAQGPRSIPIRAEAGSAVTAVIHVVPIRRAAHDIFGSSVAIAVLSEPRIGSTGAAMVQSLFDLTPAEIGVVQAIAAGQTIADIARTTNRAVETVRNQLKTAMAKTGCTRQVELVLLVRQLTDYTPQG